MKITTKRGDGGDSYINGKALKKSDPLFEVLGNLDEFNCALGFAKNEVALKGDKADRDLVGFIQENVGRAMTMLTRDEKENQEKSMTDIVMSDVEFLESKMADLEGKISVPQNFVVPGSSEISARLDLARVACRRAERSLVKLSEGKKVPEDLLKYFNRLSDFLFVLARTYD